MPTNPLEKQFALLGTASTAGLLDVQKAYRSLCHIVAMCHCCHRIFSFFRRGSTIIVLFQEEGSLTGRVCHRIWQAGRNQSSFCWGETAVLISCIIIVRAIAMLNNFLSLNRRYTSNNFLDGIWNILSFPLYLIFLHHIPVLKTFDSFQLVEDFQQKAVAAGSEDAASVATLQKCEELLPGEVIIFLSDVRSIHFH